MLSAKDTEIDKAIRLELGANDDVTKPFSWPELAARTLAVLCRPKANPGSPTEGITSRVGNIGGGHRDS